jgi:hypothetical protein
MRKEIRVKVGLVMPKLVLKSNKMLWILIERVIKSSKNTVQFKEQIILRIEHGHIKIIMIITKLLQKIMMTKLKILNLTRKKVNNL